MTFTPTVILGKSDKLTIMDNGNFVEEVDFPLAIEMTFGNQSDGVSFQSPDHIAIDVADIPALRESLAKY